MSDKKIKTITKEQIINLLTEKSNERYINVSELDKLIERAIDDKGVLLKNKLFNSIRLSYSKAVVKNIYNNLEDVLFESLTDANEEQDVLIKLFEGVSVQGNYTPETTTLNNLTGEEIEVDPKIKPKFVVTRNYREKLNETIN